ncbi:hypothetical protein [Rhizobium leguminosarum]
MILSCIIVYMLFCACLAMLCGALSGRISREEEEGRYSSGNVVPFRLRQRRS